MKKYIINILIMLGISSISIGLIAKYSGECDVKGALSKVIFKWLLCGVLCMVCYWLAESLIQYMLVRRMKEKSSFWNCFKVVMTGHFFNAVTPGASGGQPMQAYLMSKQGVSLGTSASVLLSKFIVYQCILTIYSAIVLIMGLKYFASNVSGFTWLTLIGFVVNTAVVIVLIAVGTMRGFVKKSGKGIVNLLNKIKIIKNPADIISKMDEQIEVFSGNFKETIKNKTLLISVSILTVMQLTAYFSVPYMVYRAFGLQGNSIFLMIEAAALILMLASFVPIPGSSGSAEASFMLLFSMFFPTTIIAVAVVVWRLLTFYMPLCAGALVMLLPNSKRRVKNG